MMKQSIYQKLFLSFALIIIVTVSGLAQAKNDNSQERSDAQKYSKERAVVVTKNNTANKTINDNVPTPDAIGVGVNPRVIEENRKKIERIQSNPLFAGLQNMSDEELLDFIEGNKNNVELSVEEKKYLLDIKDKIQRKINQLNEKSKY